MRRQQPRNADFTGQNEKEYSWSAVSDSRPGVSVSAETARGKKSPTPALTEARN
jgi:hypothetical protein